MMNCHQATRLISDSRDGDLHLADRTALRVHLMMCAGCRQFGKQVNVLGALTHEWVAQWGEGDGRSEELPPEADAMPPERHD